MEVNHGDIPVFSCTLETLNELTGRRYVSVSSETLVPVEAITRYITCESPTVSSLERTIRDCKERLLAQARKINPNAIVIEAKYISQDRTREMYGTGIAVRDATGEPCF